MTINMLPPLGSLFLNIASLIVFLGFSFFFVYFVLIKALNQPEIFSGIELSEAKKYTGSNLRNEELEMYSVQLIDILEKDRLFLNPNLTLKELASRLKIAPKSLSQVINQNFNQNFFDFVNSYRCEEVKNILKGKDDKITILEAMYQAGFNSKSSFNKEFKKIMGQTPTEFKKSLNRVCP
jgi:AraC-like DNA-binding protein